MNKVEVAAAAKVMLAYTEGKEIEVRGIQSDEWVPMMGNPTWNWSINRYRVKSKPREFWIHIGGENDAFNYTLNRHNPCCTECFRVREVIE